MGGTSLDKFKEFRQEFESSINDPSNGIFKSFANSTTESTYYYLSPNGSDSNDGSLTAPKYSLENVLSILPSDIKHKITIMVLPGNYSWSNAYFRNIVASTSEIGIGDSGNSLTISGCGNSPTATIINLIQYPIILNNSSGIEFMNLTISAYVVQAWGIGSAITAYSSKYKLYNCNIYSSSTFTIANRENTYTIYEYVTIVDTNNSNTTILNLFSNGVWQKISVTSPNQILYCADNSQIVIYNNDNNFYITGNDKWAFRANRNSKIFFRGTTNMSMTGSYLGFAQVNSLLYYEGDTSFLTKNWKNSSTEEGTNVYDKTSLVYGFINPNITITGSYTANTSFKTLDRMYSVVTSGGAISITLDSTPFIMQSFYIKDISGSASNNNVTINGNGKLIDGSTTKILNSNYGCINVIYNGSQYIVT